MTFVLLRHLLISHRRPDPSNIRPSNMRNQDLSAASTLAQYCLVPRSADLSELRAAVITTTPFYIGRDFGLDITVPSRTVSSRHALITEDSGKFYVEDLDSSNGTFLNGKRLTERAELKNGDMIQVSESLFQFDISHVETSSPTIVADDDECDDVLSDALACVSFDELINERRFKTHFEPIIQLCGRQIYGYEALIRSNDSSFKSAGEIFAVAEKLQQQVSLSELAREVACEDAAEFITENEKIFFNTHPDEIENVDRLLDSLRRLRKRFPKMNFVLELHESSVADLKRINSLQKKLTALEIDVAYDDFGQGQSRLLELIDASPEYLKFDLQLVRNIDSANERRKKAIQSMINMAKDLDFGCLAEGIETADEADICEDLGFDFAQGFLFA